MKKSILLSVVLFAASAALFMGCATTGGSSSSVPSSDTNAVSSVSSTHAPGIHLDEQTAEDFAVVLKSAARGAAVVAIEDDPKNAEYIKLSVTALDTFLLGQNYTPGSLSQALEPVLTQVSDPKIALAVNTVGDLYQIAYARYVSKRLDQAPIVMLFVGNLRDGAASALAITSK